MAIRSREEELWWCAPWLWRRREVILESLARSQDWCQSSDPGHNHPYFSRYEKGAGLSPVGDLLPYLFFSQNGWTLGDWRYLDHKREFFRLDRRWRFGWVDSFIEQSHESAEGLRPGFSGAQDPTLTPIDRCLWVLADPRQMDLETISEGDDTKRVCRLLQNCFDQFVSDDPHIASLWIEDGELLCGWEPLPPSDRRDIECMSNWKSSDPGPVLDAYGRRILRWGWQWDTTSYPGLDGDSGIEQRRENRVKETAEVFTPMPLALQMASEIPLNQREKKSVVMLDNSCGDGNFLVSVLHELSKYHPPNHVLDTMIYGVDLQADNVARAKQRLGVTPDRPAWQHIVCADGLEYDYEFCPQDPRLRRRY